MNPYREHLPPTAEDDYARALAAEPALRAVDNLVATLCELLPSSDEFEHGSPWDEGLQPVVAALVGPDRYIPPVDPADEATEEWLCWQPTLTAVASTLLARLYDADPVNGCGLAVEVAL